MRGVVQEAQDRATLNHASNAEIKDYESRNSRANYVPETPGSLASGPFSSTRCVYVRARFTARPRGFLTYVLRNLNFETAARQVSRKCLCSKALSCRFSVPDNDWLQWQRGIRLSRSCAENCFTRLEWIFREGHRKLPSSKWPIL